MGKYDIDAQLINESKLTLHDLSKDIYAESDASFSPSEILFKLKKQTGFRLD